MNPNEMPEVPCMICGKPVPVEVAPAQVINLETVSMVIVEHTGQITCPNCSEVVVPVIAAVGGFALGCKPVPKQQQKSLIVTPVSGLSLVR